MRDNKVVERLRLGWAAVGVGAVLGGLLFGAYGLLSRTAGTHTQVLTFELADPRSTMTALGLSDLLGVEDSAVGVADVLQTTASDTYDLDDGVRLTARGIDGSRSVVVTLTGAQSAVEQSATTFQEQFPADRAAALAETADRAIESTSSALELLRAEVVELDRQVAELDTGDGVLRERLLLDRLATTRSVLATERELQDLDLLRRQPPDAMTELVSISPVRSVGTSPLSATLLGLIFGALGGMVVVLTRQSPESDPDHSLR